ncbi:aspartyl protease family protein [Amycolatopsis thermalba]|uniref:Aspartyl protease family protein n=1 Tax=Amycolatopsis thermalba TaxID=944492 RepID=A0ABY4P3B5_9PSEU|nr:MULTISPECIES: retropepsin-like aspartic protease [Amycolatopsis]UQS26840.1 aspartyl protease family protein [Amycolatopsis thermalba]
MTLRRRDFLWQAGLAAATVPLMTSGLASAASADPDQLFRAGSFDAADRGYAKLLRKDPANARAAAQRGYIALLHNRFPDAEQFLSRALELNPGDADTTRKLVECFVRQDRHDRAVPLLGGSPFGKLYTQLAGKPWEVRGAQAVRLPFQDLDPLPTIDASVNGGEPRRFVLDTYGTLDLDQAVADELGLRSVATVSGFAGGQPVTLHLGILESIRFGDLEIRNIPMQWSNQRKPPRPDGTTPAGVIGTTVFYHLLTTMDYAGRALVLRRKDTAFRPRGERLPLWLAGDHYPCSMGSLNDYGPKIVTLDTGGIAHGLDTTVEIAERAGIAVDHANPGELNGRPVYPIVAERVSMGRAVAHDVRGSASDGPVMGTPGPGQSAMFGFDIVANFTHEFFKPFALTFDYTGMNCYLER